MIDLFINLWYNLFILGARRTGEMKKLSAKQKAWQISKCRKQLRILSKKKGCKCSNKVSVPTSRKKKIERHYLRAPAILSLLNNEKETLQFYGEAMIALKEYKWGQHIYFDLSGVEVLTIDAIMYIIALIKNVRLAKVFHVVCEGNTPKNKDACLLLEQSGFYNYVTSTTCADTDNARIRIMRGRAADGGCAGTICEFVHKSGSAKITTTKKLYSMIVELMTNTIQHAYQCKSKVMDENWFVFAESDHDNISFVFLDTGEGIPATVRKTFVEKIEKIFVANDAKLIASALRGDFRTETKEGFRGKGLPQIYSDACDGKITDLVIISGKGKCTVNCEGKIIEETLSSNFVGTLFYWNYMK